MAKKKTPTKKTSPKKKTAAKVKAKPQAVKTVVKQEPTPVVVNKTQVGRGGNKEKTSKILLIISVALVVVAFCVTFAPAFNLQYFDKDNQLPLGTGTISSLFTVMFCFMRSSYIFNVDATGEILEGSRKAIGNKYVPFAIAMASVITLLVIVAIITLILILTKKYKGKVKLAFSITTWAFLLVGVSLMFLSSVLIPSVRVPAWPESTSIVVGSVKTSLGIAPILCGTFGALALATNVTGFILDRK